MQLVIRSHFSDYSIALLSHIASNDNFGFEKVHVAVIHTGWGSKRWEQRTQQGATFAQSLGFKVHHLDSKITFEQLVLERSAFPNRKFQWCASFLKGLPMLDWLDEHDPHGEFTIAIAKVSARLGYSVPSRIEECAHHGDRAVIHPIAHFTIEQIQQLVNAAGFECGAIKSQECSPCVFSQASEISKMAFSDISKVKRLQKSINKPMFQSLGFEFDTVENDNQHSSEKYELAHGCALPFGCGL